MTVHYVNYKFCSITASLCTLLTLSTQASCCLQVFLCNVFIPCLRNLAKSRCACTVMVHGVCGLLSSRSGQLQVVDRFTQHQVALTDAVLYNLAACKHVWDSFSTSSDHAGRCRDRGALYQIY